MSGNKALENSQESMEIEEISFTESTSFVEPFFKSEIKKEKDVKMVEDSRPRTILRESKLSKIFEGDKIAESEAKDRQDFGEDEKKATEITKTNSKPGVPKSKLRSLVKKDENRVEKNENSVFYYFWQMLFFILFPIAVLVVCVSIVRVEFDSDVCAHRFNAGQAIVDLEKRLFGQAKAIEKLGNSLEINSSDFKVLIFIGGTGVGKSYAAHIISENFPVKRNVFQYVPPLKSKRRLASGVVSICGCNLIILENLNNRDIMEAANFVENLARRVKNVDYCSLIIEVLNVQETDDDLKHHVDLAGSERDIENIYGSKNLHVDFVEFEPLGDEVLTKCIVHAAETINLTLDESQIEEVRIGLKSAESGCKGAWAKVQLLDKKWI